MEETVEEKVTCPHCESSLKVVVAVSVEASTQVYISDPVFEARQAGMIALLLKFDPSMAESLEEWEMAWTVYVDGNMQRFMPVSPYVMGCVEIEPGEHRIIVRNCLTSENRQSPRVESNTIFFTATEVGEVKLFSISLQEGGLLLEE